MKAQAEKRRADAREVFASLGRQLFAAAAPREVALAAMTAADELFGWDACYLQILKGSQAQIESVTVMDVRGGRSVEVPGWSEDAESVSAAAAEFERGPQLLTSSSAGEWTARLLGEAQVRPVSAMVVPVGRLLGRFAQLSIQSYEADAYSPADLDLLQTLGDFCGDSLHRCLSSGDPNSSPYALTEENRLLRMLIDTLPDYLYIKDAEGRFIFANAALVRSLGAATLQDVLGKDDSDFARPDLQAQYRADEMAVISSGKPLIDRQELVIEASGERVRVSTTKVPLRDSQGRIIGLVGVGHSPQPETVPTTFQRGTAAETAKRAGVSVATVSRAFNGSPLVTEETRQRIFAVAREIGYRPNVAARNLSRGRSDTVAIVLKSSHLVGEFYGDVLAGFQAAVNSRGLEVLLSVVPDNESPHAWVHRLISGGGCGALAAHHEVLAGADAAMLSSFPLPVVVTNYCPDRDDPLGCLTTVGFDNRSGVKHAVRHLVALGHRRIAWIGGTPGHPDARDREAGFRASMEECGLPVNEKWTAVCRFDASPPESVLAIQEILASEALRPTAAVCASDALAGGVVIGARKWGQTVPEDLSVTGFDDLSWASLYSPPLTTVRHKGHELGVAAGEALLARIDNPSRKPETILLPTRLVVRETTAPPKPDFGTKPGRR